MKTKLLILTLTLISALTHAETENPKFILHPGDASKASVDLNFEGTSEITLTLVKEKQDAFGVFTKENIGKKIDLVIDGKTVASPVLMAPITGPTLSIASNKPLNALHIVESLVPEKP